MSVRCGWGHLAAMSRRGPVRGAIVGGVEHAHVLGGCIQACGRLGMRVGLGFDDERLGGLLSSVV